MENSPTRRTRQGELRVRKNKVLCPFCKEQTDNSGGQCTVITFDSELFGCVRPERCLFRPDDALRTSEASHRRPVGMLLSQGRTTFGLSFARLMGCDHARHYVPLMADGRGTDDDFRMRDGSRRMKARTNISVTITWNEYGCGAVGDFE